MDSVAVDLIDRRLIHALQIDGRASFSRIGAVIGVGDQTAARRYRRLRRLGVARVTGQTNPWRIGQTRWHVRIRTTPDSASAIAEALAGRPDTYWVRLVSGGSEIACVVQAENDAHRDRLLLNKLPRTSRVIDFTAHALLHMYFGGDGEFPTLVDELHTEQIAALRPELPEPGPDAPLSRADWELVAALNRDGRASHAELAASTGLSESTCRRRLTELRARGAVNIDIDIDPVALGFETRAMLWLTVPPAELAAVGTVLAVHPEIAFAAAITGPTNLVAAVVCRDTHGLYEYINQRLGKLTAIRHFEVSPVIRLFKGAGSVYQ